MSQAIADIIPRVVARTSTKVAPAKAADDDLITLCNGVVEIQAKRDKLHADCPDDIEAEKSIEPEAIRLWNQRERLVTKIARNLEARDGLPTSATGAVAAARAALALAEKDSAGDLMPESDAEWLAYTIS
jgi:hypothetical protein